jgi:hypothetical protein
MFYTIIVNIYEYLLVTLFPYRYEYKNISRVNSTGSVVEYCDDD